MQAAFDTPLTKQMRAHRSIRSYKPDPLPEGMPEAIVSSVQVASTSSCLQQYSIVAVEDRAWKERMAYTDPARLRIEVGRAVREQGFGLE